MGTNQSDVRSLATAATRPTKVSISPKYALGSRSTKIGLFPWFCLCVLLCVIIPLWLTLPLRLSLDVSTLGSQGLVVLYAGIRTASSITRAEPRWIQMSFWFFCYIWLGLAGLVQESAQTNPYLVPLTPNAYVTSSTIALLGMACFDFGQGISQRRGISPRFGRGLSTRRVAWALAITPLVTPLLVELIGGWGSLFVTRSQRTELLERSGLLTDQSKVIGGLLGSLAISVPLVVSLAAILTLRANPSLRRRPAWLIGVATSGLLALIVGNPIGNSRFWAGTVILALVFSTGWAASGRGYLLVACAVLTSFLLLFPYADIYRYEGSQLQTESLTTLMLTKGDYDASTQMATAVMYRDATGGTGGSQALGVIGFLVPRSLWPGKPGATGALLAQFVNYPQLNVSSPLWIEAYVDGGYVAVGLLFLALGVLARRLAAGQKGPPNSWASVSAILLGAYAPFVLRGSLLSAIGPMCALLGVAWLMTAKNRSLA